MDKRRKFLGLLHDARGGTAVEYGLIACLVVIGAIGALKGVAGANTKLWNTVSNEVQANPGR